MDLAPDLKTLTDLYRCMLRIRLAEERIAQVYPTDKIQSPIHLSLGQEAVAAGVCRALATSDRVYGTYRGHGFYIAKGGDLEKMFAELYGKDTGCARGKGGSMHLIAPEVGFMGCSAIVASTIPVAVGDALASQMQGRPRVVVAVFGDGAVDEGVFFESVNFAVLKDLPVLFVLENNGYAVHSRVRDRHKQTELFRIADGLGLRGSRHDGNDAWTVFSAVADAVAGLRRGGPPALVEFQTFRWQEHVGPGRDWTEAYREPGEKELALANDPLRKGRDALLEYGVPVDRLRQWEAEIREELDTAVRFAETSPFPGPDELSADLYA